MSDDLPFVEFRKIPRYSREVVVTEKIDGTNGVIHIPDSGTTLLAGSRSRWLTDYVPDNHGFKAWAFANKEELLKLGPGTHYGEWWGKGIQRGYGLNEKRFSLFNVKKWSDDALRPKCCHVVPVLTTVQSFEDLDVNAWIEWLKYKGSQAAPGFMKPEGIIIYHVAGGVYFKKTIEKDQEGKNHGG